LNRIYIKQLFL